MDPRLLLTTVGYGLDALLFLGLIIILFSKGRGRPAAVTFALTLVGALAFIVSHAIGINIADPALSRRVFMWNLSNLFIVAFNAHAVLALLGKAAAHRKALYAIYASSAALFVFYLAFPDTFLIDPVPKLYLPNYYEPGSLYLLMRVHFVAVAGYFFYHLVASYRRSDPVARNRIKYLIIALFFGYSFGSTAVFLVYDIPFDPIWSVFFAPLFAIPFTVAILKYELLDVRIIAKRAFLYAVAVGAVGIGIALFNAARGFVAAAAPAFPAWPLDLLLAYAAVQAAVVIWRKLRETDLLKYEFITVVTHKFRTPLTRIKWSADNLLRSALAPPERETVADIEQANTELVELTNVLIGLTDSERSGRLYRFEDADVSALVAAAAEEYRPRFMRKKIEFSVLVEPGLHAYADAARLRFVLGVFLGNALAYTQKGGRVSLRFAREGRRAALSVSDSGIGIPREELKHAFVRFFRGARAKLADTEGMGVGLYIAKAIIERHGGRIAASSGGISKGSTFSFTLPLSEREPARIPP